MSISSMKNWFNNWKNYIVSDLKSLNKKFIILLIVASLLSLLFGIINFDNLIAKGRLETVFGGLNQKSTVLQVASILTPLNAVLSILYVYLLTQGRITAYLYGFLSSLTYAFIAFSLNYIGEFVISLIYLPFFIYGYFIWKKTRHMSAYTLEKKKTKSLTTQEYIICVVTISISTILWILVIPEISRSLIGTYAFQNLPTQWLLDALTNGVNMMGIFLMIKGYRNQYDMWLIVNILSIAIYTLIMVNGQFFAISLVMIFAIYLGATLIGIRSWYFGKLENNTKNPSILLKLHKLYGNEEVERTY